MNKSFLIFVIIIFCIALVFAEAPSAYGPSITKDYYTISRSKIEREISLGNLFTDSITIENKKGSDLVASISASDSLSNIVEVESAGVIVPAGNSSIINLLIKGKELGNYTGSLMITGDLSEEIPVIINVVNTTLNPKLLVKTDTAQNQFMLNQPVAILLNVNKLTADEINNATFSYNLKNENNDTFFLGSEVRDVANSFQVVKTFTLPKNITEGTYRLETTVEYGSDVIVVASSFSLKKSFFSIMILGLIPMWMALVIIGLLIAALFSYIMFKHYVEKGKKYRMNLDFKKIPKKDPAFLHLGKIAEMDVEAYLEPNRLTTHAIVAGATGSGKSIGAQVLVEEALLHNIAVIVFDPTAQWSGMLRKCTDKNMMKFYPKFGLKESDSKAFPGNIRSVKNSREKIDISKYVHPGQIQILTLNKLDPSEIDIFIANVIRQIFRSDPQESPDLKILLVFDEVHRLLAKFGGNGEGFLQIERACREFRKWGMGILLISQVLSDFVGEIKANINTELQMRTRDEGDLNRIKTKYGGEFLQSLVKASVGVGMFVNASYNNASPYFINFRPILHNTRRLTDEELEKYNKYNEIVEDLEYQLEQLEKEKVDTFDLKMELKLVKDKIMTGNFSIVDIYLEGLQPRMEKEWGKIGKKPAKKELELVDESEIKKSIEEAKKSRQEWEKQEKKTKAEEAKKTESEKEEDIFNKPLKPLTLDNGAMISSIKELGDVLELLDPAVFKVHVNKKKNDIADWIEKEIGKEAGDKLRVLGKDEIIKAISEIKNKKSGTEEGKS